MSFLNLLRDSRQSLAIGCQLVAPGVLIQVVNPGSKIVLIPYTTKDHHFGVRQGDHCSLNPVGCEGYRASLFDRELPCLEVSNENSTGGVSRELEEPSLNLAGLERLELVAMLIWVEHLHFCGQR